MWVVDFPMFEENDDGSFSALHHPFTAPKCSPQELEANPAGALSRAYDMVLNGTELGGGSIRIHRKEMQQAVFRLLGINEAEQEEVRLPARRPEIRRAAARWFGVRPGPSGDADDRRPVDP